MSMTGNTNVELKRTIKYCGSTTEQREMFSCFVGSNEACIEVHPCHCCIASNLDSHRREVLANALFFIVILY